MDQTRVRASSRRRTSDPLQKEDPSLFLNEDHFPLLGEDQNPSSKRRLRISSWMRTIASSKMREDERLLQEEVKSLLRVVD